LPKEEAGVAEPDGHVAAVPQVAAVANDGCLPSVLPLLCGVRVPREAPAKEVGPCQLEGEVGVVVAARGADGGTGEAVEVGGWQVVVAHLLMRTDKGFLGSMQALHFFCIVADRKLSGGFHFSFLYATLRHDSYLFGFFCGGSLSSFSFITKIFHHETDFFPTFS
jgi:hypothetical protein